MNKSIAGYKIFPYQSDCKRFLRLIRFFNLIYPPTKFSYFLSVEGDNKKKKNQEFEARLDGLIRSEQEGQHVQVIAYCLMPTHFHILARQLNENGVVALFKHSLNAYARYFNAKYKRQGTLWMGRFQNKIIENDMILLHVIRYIHLNPVRAGLVQKPEDWPHSSYPEYIARDGVEYPLTNYAGLVDCVGDEHRQFCEDQASYQRELSLIKDQIME